MVRSPVTCRKHLANWHKRSISPTTVANQQSKANKHNRLAPAFSAEERSS